MHTKPGVHFLFMMEKEAHILSDLRGEIYQKYFASVERFIINNSGTAIAAGIMPLTKSINAWSRYAG